MSIDNSLLVLISQPVCESLKHTTPQKEIWSYGWPYDRRPSYGHLRTGRRMAIDVRIPLYGQHMTMFNMSIHETYGQPMISQCAVGPLYGQ